MPSAFARARRTSQGTAITWCSPRMDPPRGGAARPHVVPATLRQTAAILSLGSERSYTAGLLRGALGRTSRHGLRHGEEAMDPLNLIRFVPA